MKFIKHQFQKNWPVVVPVLFLVLATLFFVTTKDQLRYGNELTERNIVDVQGNIGEITANDIVEQEFIPDVDIITQFSIYFATYGRENTDILQVEIFDEQKSLLYSGQISTQGMQDNAFLELPEWQTLKQVRGQKLLLKISSQQGDYGNAVTIYYGQSLSEQPLLFNGVELPGSLCLEILGKEEVEFDALYWSLTSVLLALGLIYGIYVRRREQTGHATLAGTAVINAQEYGFLLRQLVSRDFKTKYKRSVLGILWSLLNPLLTMLVQYIVFSQLFRFEIPNYPVYLLSGTVFFNYMSDATSQSMTCIIQNASLINKVYVPKYIYPFSRVLSCGINFLLSLIALYVVILITGMTITLNHVFLIYGILCTFVFILGVSFFLSALMVFFRDVQFLYGIFLQMWIYLTPLFYPENILPQAVMRIVKLNPMYHFISFIRTIIMTGDIPAFEAWIVCALFAGIPFAGGYHVFRKMQNKFILYI